MVDQITLKLHVPLYGLFYLYILQLILFALKFPLTQQTNIKASIGTTNC